MRTSNLAAVLQVDIRQRSHVPDGSQAHVSQGGASLQTDTQTMSFPINNIIPFGTSDQQFQVESACSVHCIIQTSGELQEREYN